MQNLFYATAEPRGSSLSVRPQFGKSQSCRRTRNKAIEETTGFPFRKTVNFQISTSKEIQFPFHLRIPSWTTNASITINDEPINFENVNGIAVIDRQWKDGDRLQLTLPMEITTSVWHEFSTTVERGPLVYALKIAGEEIQNRREGYGEFTEVVAKTPWNYGLLQKQLDKLPVSATVAEQSWDGEYPWNLENAPVAIIMQGLRIPEWEATNGLPYFPAFWGDYLKGETPKTEDIILVPYGCTTLRITEFPTYR